MWLGVREDIFDDGDLIKGLHSANMWDEVNARKTIFLGACITRKVNREGEWVCMLTLQSPKF